MKQNRLIFALCCLALAGMQGTAMAQQDSTAAGKKAFDAKDYLLQRRYVPQARYIDKTAKGRNFSIGVFGGMSKLQGEGSWLPVMNEFGLSLTKDVNGFNSYRISVMGGKNEHQMKAGLEIDHIFRLQDYLTGWRPDRNFTVDMVVGAGFYATKPENAGKDLAGGLHGGLMLTRRLGENWDLYLEPRLNLYTDGIDAREAARRYDIGMQALAGLRYRLTGLEYRNIRNRDFMDNMFYEIYVGTQGDFSSRVRSYMNAKKALGPTAGIAIGKWVYPLGIKASAFGGWGYTPNDTRKAVSEEPYLGLRLEAMVNLNSFFMSMDEAPRFELNASGGYDFGALAHKGSLYSKKIRFFNGPTAALQALYFVRPDIGIFAQGRWSSNSYSQGFTDGRTENRVMRNLGLELGVQYRRRYEKVEEMHRRHAFEPYSFVSAQLGTNFPFHTAGVSKSVLLDELGQQFSITYGRRYSRIAAVRGMLEAARYGYARHSGTYPLTIGGDLMIDALAIIGGYNDERIVNIYPYGGVLYTHNETGDENNFGIRGGADLMFRVNRNWGIFLQGDVRMYKGQITPSARVYTSARLSLVPNMSVGLSYRL